MLGNESFEEILSHFRAALFVVVFYQRLTTTLKTIPICFCVSFRMLVTYNQTVFILMPVVFAMDQYMKELIASISLGPMCCLKLSSKNDMIALFFFGRHGQLLSTLRVSTLCSFRFQLHTCKSILIFSLFQPFAHSAHNIFTVKPLYASP